MKTKTKQLCKRIIATLCAAFMVLGAVVSDVGTITARAEEATHTLWIVGDSTVCSFNDSYYYPRYGYGTQIGEYLDGAYTVQNLAASGRSSKSYLTDSKANYDTLISGIQEGDVLVIGFGHNDEKAEDARYTNPNGDYQTAGSFAKCLYDNYIKPAKDVGAEVILCTPIVRRNPNGDTISGSNCHIITSSSEAYPGGDYPEAIRKLGDDVSVPVIDLTALTKDLYEEIGKDETLYLHAWLSNKESSVDDTHLNIYGAKMVAYLFAKEAKDTATAFASHVDLTKGEPSKGTDLVSNPGYVVPEYDSNLAQSKLFPDYVIGEGSNAVYFKGTVFGNGVSVDTTNNKLETDANGNMRIAVLNNKGKITSNDDGIAMYYYKVPAGSEFKLSATATVTSIADYGQAGFGLMARDDMYIDVNKTGIGSDYVAAGSLGGDTACNCFYRKDTKLGGKAALTTETLGAGKSYNLSIETTGDGYACTFGNEPTQTAGYDFQLTSIDSDYVYIGMFVARNADVTFSDISLEVDGKVLTDLANSGDTGDDDPLPGARKIDVWDFGGKTETNTSLYVNNILPKTWTDKSGLFTYNATDKRYEFADSGTVSFGDLTLNYIGADRLYSDAPELKSTLNAGTSAYAQNAYSDGYVALGAYYANGTGGDSRRLVTIENVEAGDKITAYIGTHSGSSNNTDTTFYFEYMGEDGTQKESVNMDAAKFQKCEFVAEYTGTYKIWEGNRCKPMYHRIMRVPGVEVTGTIDFGTYQGTDRSLKFVNMTTKKETTAVLDGSNFTVTLAPGFTYTAVFSGSVEYGISNESKTVTTTDAESVTGKNGVALRLVAKDIYTYSGKVTGFEDGYDVSGLSVTLTPPKGSDLDEVTLVLDENLNFTTNLEQGYEYTISIAGVNDYELKSSGTIISTTDVTADIVVGLKNRYDVTGGFIGLDSAKVTELTFTNIEDGYDYTADVTDNGYSVKLRNGSYLAKAVAEDHSTQTHVVVSNRAVSKDLMFVSTAVKENIQWAANIYVGYPDKANNYDTVREAVEACKLMNPQDERHRIKVHIAPGTYREQVIIDTPYISFVNDTDDEVLLTWYYGIGYKYYSADATGFYNPENAYDKFYKNGDSGSNVSTWGVTVMIKNTATAFRAEGITFESSFNRYVTQEEVDDGVEPADSAEGAGKPARKIGVDVQSKAATERATAVGIEADLVEFKNCGFYSSQDTLYTGGATIHNVYFKNCLIEGQTDYIFGDGNCIFDACELRWKGYSTGSTGGYITAARLDSGGVGYLFRDCTVTANSELTVTGGAWGRPWRQSARVVFLNTKLEKASLITAAGWNDMSGNTADNAYFYEYNTTTTAGQAVDTSKRSKHVMTAEQAAAITMSDYFGSWIPVFYEDKAEKQELMEFAIAPVGDKTYGDEAFELSVTGEEDATGAVTFESSDESVIRLEDNKAVILKAGTAVITAIKAEDDIYAEGVADLIVKVDSRALTVRAESKLNVIQGSDMPALTFKAEGLVSGDIFADPVISAEVNNTNTVGTYEVTISGGTVTNAEGADMTDSYDITYVEGKIVVVEDPDRVAGLSRYETSLQSADTLKELRGVDQFEAVVIAAGGDFPDALAGSTLAVSKNAPILLAGKDLSSETTATLEYVKENVKPGGEIYILGGSSAVSVEAEQQLKADGYQVTRIAGTNRYETNMQLLENLKVPEGRDVIIASGKNYPDSIAVSGIAGAMGMPIILTNEKLTDEALEKIKEIKPEHIYLIGGTSAVSEAVEEQVQGLGEVKRVAGTNRFATSLEIAKAFGLDNADSVVIAYGNNFPDGLTGSVIAAEANAPIILVSDSNYQDQAEFIRNCNIKSYYILGGTGVISDETIKALLGL